MKKICIAATLVLLMTALPAAAEISVSQSGRLVTVSGELDEKIKDQKVTVTVKNSDGEYIYLGQTSCDSDGEYTVMFSPETDKNQSLDIVVRAANENLSSETASFNYKKTSSSGSGGGGGGGGSRKPSGGSVASIQSGVIANTTPTVPTVPETQKQPQWLLNLTAHWAYNDIETLVNDGVIDKNMPINPDESITRLSFVEMICKATNRKADRYTSVFTDVDAENPAALYLQAAVDDGIISVDTVFRPNDSISRQEMCKVLCLAAGLSENEASEKKFTDDADFDQWAIPHIYSAAEAGLVNGMPDGSFAPFGNVTCAQAAAVTNRIKSK